MFTNSILFLQSGPKWSVNGNNVSSSSFIGTTNNQALRFKTNNQLRVKIKENGTVKILGNLKLKPFSNINTGLITYNANGKLIPFYFNNDSNSVPLGNGSFGSISNFGWQLNGNNLYNTNSGFVGINTNLPQAPLDVNGDAIIRGTLHVFNGIVIGRKYTGEKVDVDTLKSQRVETTKIEAVEINASDNAKINTINIDGINSKIYSTTGYIDFGNTNLKTTGAINANSLNIIGQTSLSELHITDSIKIGSSSIWIGGFNAPAGNYNTIYTTWGSLVLQGGTGPGENTVINAYNDGRVGIGTMNINNAGDAKLNVLSENGNGVKIYTQNQNNPSTNNYGLKIFADPNTPKLLIASYDYVEKFAVYSDKIRIDDVLEVDDDIKIINGKLSFSDGTYTHDVLYFDASASPQYNKNLRLQSHGELIIGSGESVDRLISDGLSTDYENFKLSSDNDISFYTNCQNTPKNILHLDNTGNIGIGTTSPNARLEIRTDSGNELVFTGGWGANALPIVIYIFWQEQTERFILEQMG